MFFTVSGGAYGPEDVSVSREPGRDSSSSRSDPIAFPDEETQQRLVFTEDLGEAVEELYEDATERVVAD